MALKLKQQVEAQKDLLIRAQKWVGVAAGTLASAQDKNHFSYPMRDQLESSLSCASDIANYLRNNP